MIFYKNNILDNLLYKYNLSIEVNKNILLPNEINELLSCDIVKNIYGVGLSKIFIPKKSSEGEKYSYYEDTNNHFHVDWFIENGDIKKTLSLALTTLILLANKFENANMTGIRFWLSFETPEMGKEFAIKNNLHEKGDKYYISDRLSFYTIREGEDVINIDNINNCTTAILIIDT